MQNPENVQKSQGNPEILSRAHPGGPGLRREKDEKMPDPPPQAERPGERKNVSGEGREPSPGRKLPPRATIKKRSAPSTPCSDQTRGPEPSPGDQGRGDPKNPMGKSAESPDHRENPEEKPLEPPTVAPLTRASVDPLAPPSGWAERVGQSGRGDKDPCGTSGEGLAVRQDRAARASARAARAGEACDMDSRGLEHDLESSSNLGFHKKMLSAPCDMVRRGTASQNFDAAGVDQQSFAKVLSMSDCDMASRGPAQQIVVAGMVETQKGPGNFPSMSGCDMVGRELEHDLESNSSLGFQEKILCNPCDMVAESSAQQIAVAVEIQNVVRAMSGHDMVTEKICDLANEENRSNEKNPAQQIAGANAEKHSQEKISASETFWQEAFEMERQKNSCGETSDQGQRSSDEALLPAGTQDALEERENEVREFTTRSESSGGGSQAPKPPCKGFMQKCKEMVAGYLAPSTSSTRNDHPGPEENENQEGVAANDPEPNLGEGEFSPKTSELQISPLSSEKKTQEGEQNAEKPPSLGMPLILKMKT